MRKLIDINNNWEFTPSFSSAATHSRDSSTNTPTALIPGARSFFSSATRSGETKRLERGAKTKPM